MNLVRIMGPSPWSRLHDAIRPVGFAIGFIGLGAIADGVYNGTAKLPWLHQQAAELHVAKTVTIPKLKKATHCEAVRGDKASMVAQQAIASVEQEDIPTPDPSAIPSDDCPHPKP